MCSIRRCVTSGAALGFLGAGLCGLVAVAEDEPGKPEREVAAAFEYPRKETDITENLGLDLIIKNNGRKDETVLLEIVQSPPECVTRIEQYGDAIVNGKFLAGFLVIAITMVGIVLLIAGLGMVVVGVVPTWEEVARLLLYLLLSTIYIGFWLGLAILFSILFRSIGTSALAAIACWILVSFLVSLAGGLIADAVAPANPGSDVDQILKRERIASYVNRMSPVNLYTEAASVIMDPRKKTTKTFLMVGPMETISMSRFNNPLGLLQSTLVVAPHLITIIALTVVCFAAAYLVFMRQEIRSI